MEITTKKDDKSKVEYAKVKVFLSQPMSGLSDDEVLLTRKNMFKLLQENSATVLQFAIEDKDEYNFDFEYLENSKVDIEIIDNTQFDEKLDLQYLGYDIDKMAEADVVVFAPGWENSRGCKVEFHIASEYKYRCMFINGCMLASGNTTIL